MSCVYQTVDIKQNVIKRKLCNHFKMSSSSFPTDNYSIYTKMCLAFQPTWD